MNDLKASGLKFTVLSQDKLGYCNVENSVLLNQSLYKYTGTKTIRGTCQQISALSRWEQSVVRPAAMRHFGVPVSTISQMGNYSCRRISGTNKLSEHGKANAIDIGGFTLRDGTRISVLKDWGKNTASGRFLDEIHQGSCRIFNGVLSPNYNAAHRDHFHFDMGKWKTCK